MSRASRPRVPSLALALAALTAAACVADPTTPATPRPESGAALGKVAAGPRVDSTAPAATTRGVTLDVRVLGAGFDASAAVSFQLNGAPQSKVVVNGTRYVSGGELVANVSVAGDAPLDAYDVVVTMGGGKKGMGVEMFTVTWVEQPATGASVSLWDVNAQRWMVGFSTDQALPRHATLVRDGQALDIHPSVDGLPESYASGVNDAGLVVGYANETRTGNERGVVWTSFEPVQVARLATIGGLFSVARAVNGAGQIVGASGPGTNAMHAVLWPTAGAAPIHLLPDSQRSRYGLSSAEKISEASGDSVWIAGWADVQYGTDQRVPYVWLVVGGTPVLSQALPIPAIRGYTRASAYGVNRHGLVVGRSSGDRQPFRAVRWRRTGLQWAVDTLPGLLAGGDSHAQGVNDAGQIVGSAAIRAGTTIVLWTTASGATSVLRLGVKASAGNLTRVSITNDQTPELNTIVAGGYQFTYPQP